MSDERDDAPRSAFGNSAHGEADHQVTLEQDGEELTEDQASIAAEHSPGGGHAVASFRDVDAEERAKKDDDA